MDTGNWSRIFRIGERLGETRCDGIQPRGRLLTSGEFAQGAAILGQLGLEGARAGEGSAGLGGREKEGMAEVMDHEDKAHAKPELFADLRSQELGAGRKEEPGESFGEGRELEQGFCVGSAGSGSGGGGLAGGGGAAASSRPQAA